MREREAGRVRGTRGMPMRENTVNSVSLIFFAFTAKNRLRPIPPAANFRHGADISGPMRRTFSLPFFLVNARRKKQSQSARTIAT